MTELYELRISAIEELKEWANDNFDEGYLPDPNDTIVEIADSHVPIYTSDLMQLAADNINLATDEPEIGPAFDGTPTPVNIVAANVFEYLEHELFEAWVGIEEALQEDYEIGLEYEEEE